MHVHTTSTRCAMRNFVAVPYHWHTCPILRYATDGKNVLTIGKYEYRFVTCSAKRNVISLLGAGGVRFKILSNGTTGTIGKIWLPIVKLRLPSLNYVQTVAKVDIFMRIESYSKLIKRKLIKYISASCFAAYTLV